MHKSVKILSLLVAIAPAFSIINVESNEVQTSDGVETIGGEIACTKENNGVNTTGAPITNVEDRQNIVVTSGLQEEYNKKSSNWAEAIGCVLIGFMLWRIASNFGEIVAMHR